MLRSTGQDDTDEQMNLPSRREAKHRGRGTATKFGFETLPSCGSDKGGKKRSAVKQKTFLQRTSLNGRIPPGAGVYFLFEMSVVHADEKLTAFLELEAQTIGK
jgi:hypothetical protein